MTQNTLEEASNGQELQQTPSSEHLYEIYNKNNNNNNTNNDIMTDDTMGISVVVPVLPYFGEMFGANSFENGALLSSYESTATLATLMMGKCSDSFGRRPMILLSLFGTMIGFLITGFAQNYVQLLICRFICGLFGSSKPIAQAFITDVIPDKLQRNKYLSLSCAAVGMAFVIGPGIGAVMAALFGLRAAFFAAAALGAIGFILAYFRLIESHQENPNQIDSDFAVPPIIYMLCFIFMLQQIGWTAYLSMYLLYMIRIYDFKVYQGGITIVGFAIFYVLTAGYLYHKISKKIGCYNSCLLGCAVFAFFMQSSMLTNHLWLTLGLMFVCFGFGESMATSSMSVLASNYTNESNRGYIMGIINVSSLISRIIGPLIHGALFKYNPKLPFYFGAGSAGIAFIMLLLLRSKIIQRI